MHMHTYICFCEGTWISRAKPPRQIYFMCTISQYFFINFCALPYVFQLYASFGDCSGHLRVNTKFMPNSTFHIFFMKTCNHDLVVQILPEQLSILTEKSFFPVVHELLWQWPPGKILGFENPWNMLERLESCTTILLILFSQKWPV